MAKTLEPAAEVAKKFIDGHTRAVHGLIEEERKNAVDAQDKCRAWPIEMLFSIGALIWTLAKWTLQLATVSFVLFIAWVLWLVFC